MNAPPPNVPTARPVTWSHPPRIDIVESDPAGRAAIESFLRREGFTIQTFNSGESFLETAFRDAPEIVLIGIRLPGLGSIETVTRFKNMHPDSAIIFLSDENSADICAQAARLGAFDIILKPFQKTCLTTAIRNALQKRDLIREMKKLKSELRVRYNFTSIIGSTPAMTRMVATLKRLAASDVPVLLHGERGSGKELAARTIHYNSRFADGPFLCVNCSVLRDDLLEYEVISPFRRRAAARDRKTHEQWMKAKGGTLFLDDISDMDLSLLNKLLKRLKTYVHFHPGEGHAPIEFRIICGTREDIGSGGTNLEAYSEFFQLLAPFQVKIPSLRNRTDDIPLLIRHFLNNILREKASHRAIPHITPEALKVLKSYPWPGNIRELRNVIRQTFLLNDSDRIGPEDLPASIQNCKARDPIGPPGVDGTSPPPIPESGWKQNEIKHEFQHQEVHSMDEGARKSNESGGESGKKKPRNAPFPTLRESERKLITEALEFTNWNMKRTASLLAISRPALYRRIEKLNITRDTPTQPATGEERNPSSGGDTGPPTVKADAGAGMPSAIAV